MDLELKRQLLGCREQLGLRPYDDAPRRTAAGNENGAPPEPPEPSAGSVGKASGPPRVSVADVWCTRLSLSERPIVSNQIEFSLSSFGATWLLEDPQSRSLIWQHFTEQRHRFTGPDV
ncbi:hypothetical protein ISCGN_019576 [Ixodes scapularis]